MSFVYEQVACIRTLTACTVVVMHTCWNKHAQRRHFLLRTSGAQARSGIKVSPDTHTYTRMYRNIHCITFQNIPIIRTYVSLCTR